MPADLLRGSEMAFWTLLLSTCLLGADEQIFQVHKVNIQGKMRGAGMGGISGVETEKQNMNPHKMEWKNIRKSGSLFIKDYSWRPTWQCREMQEMCGFDSVDWEDSLWWKWQPLQYSCSGKFLGQSGAWRKKSLAWDTVHDLQKVREDWAHTHSLAETWQKQTELTFLLEYVKMDCLGPSRQELLSTIKWSSFEEKKDAYIHTVVG